MLFYYRFVYEKEDGNIEEKCGYVVGNSRLDAKNKVYSNYQDYKSVNVMVYEQNDVTELDI